MKTGKNISTLFQEGAGKLRMQPSAQGWERLESRLARHDRNAKVVRLRWIAAMAAMLVLVWAVWFWNGSMRKNRFALLDSPPPQHLEDLKNLNGCEPFCLVLKARQELPAYYAHPVEKN